MKKKAHDPSVNEKPRKSEEARTVSPEFFVAVGASAGGLEAIEQFFSNIPLQCGMAYIVIQHLSPDHKSLMVELLSKRTMLPVHRAETGQVVEADSIYLIPPKKNLRIFKGKLVLSDQEELHRGLNLPIDIFFRSLAEDQPEKAIGVILSGTGSDGMRGVRAIKEGGGMVMVQAPDTAKFNGMPNSAISTGLVDFILPPEEMAMQLQLFSRHPDQKYAVPHKTGIGGEDAYTRIFAVLREKAGIDFTHYKQSTVSRRIERRMLINQTNSIDDYASHLERSPDEHARLHKELLIGVTNFFRDPETFTLLRDKYLPELLTRFHGKSIRLWSAGCSTGEEAYSLAILCKDVCERLNIRTDIKIFATDVDREAVIAAGNGVYPESITADIPPEYLIKYFYPQDGKHRIIRSVRETVVFAQHNLTMDPPFTNIEVLFCRNLLIYLQPILQRKVLEYFSFSLNPKGVLVLGSSESIGEMADNFELLHSKWKIFRFTGRIPGTALLGGALPVNRLRPHQVSASGILSSRRQQSDDGKILERLLNSARGRYLPLTIVVNERLEPIHICGETGGYFKLPSGKMSNDITKMAERSLSIPLATGLQNAFGKGEESRYTNIRFKKEDTPILLTLHTVPLAPLKEQEKLAAIFIEEISVDPPHPEENALFSYDVTKETEQRLADLEQELQFTRENLQATIEELETSNEELQATNEELLASNEELQSTNEELHSVNEELHTVNSEYQLKIMELTELNNDLNNLFANTKVGIIFLDENLDIRKFTPPSKKLFQLTEKDLGRPIEHLPHCLVDVDPMSMIRTVQKNDAPMEREVQTSEGLWFLLQITPYQIGPQAFSGIMITGTNISQIVDAQAAVFSARADEEKASSLAHAALDSMPSHIAILDRQGVITAVNRAWQYFAKKNAAADHPSVRVGCNYLDVCDTACGLCHEGAREFAAGIREVLSGRLPTYEQEYPCHGPHEQRWFIGRVSRFSSNDQFFAVVSHENITARVLAERRTVRTSEYARLTSAWSAKVFGGIHLVENSASLCRAIVDELGYRLCWVGVARGASPETFDCVAHYGVPGIAPSMLEIDGIAGDSGVKTPIDDDGGRIRGQFSPLGGMAEAQCAHSKFLAFPVLAPPLRCVVGVLVACSDSGLTSDEHEIRMLARLTDETGLGFAMHLEHGAGGTGARP